MIKKFDNGWKNIIFTLISFGIVFIAFNLAGLVVDSGIWVMIIFLILIYFEISDLNNNRRNKK